MTLLPTQGAAYNFRPMSAHDLTLVRTWQMAPHVREWWDDDPITLASEDEPAMDQYIVAVGGQPLAYLQCYLQSAYPENGLGTQPAGTRGIDQFIGEPGMVGRGHGAAFIRSFVDGLLSAGVPRVLTDPNVVNARAIRAYEKAGFRADREIDSPDGRELLMIRDSSSAGVTAMRQDADIDAAVGGHSTQDRETRVTGNGATAMVARRVDYDFRPMSPDDLPLMRRWLEMPHIREWWGDPETELRYMRDMIEGRDTTRPFTFAVDGERVGHIQYWFLGDYQNASWIADHPWLAELPSDAVGVDLSIGDPRRLSQGIGSGVLRAFAEGLVGQGYRTIIIDPDPANERAVRAYRKAGFRAIPRLLGRTGDTLIMQFDVNENDPAP